MAIGQAGSLSTNSPTENAPITVTFDQPLDNPVIALTATNNGGNQFTMRVIDVDENGFTFIIEEWEYHDGPHGAVEDINWIAIEAGVHTLPDGRVIEAGTTSADNTNSSVSLSGTFTDPPVVLTSVMSENDTITVDSDPLNITNTGFNVRLQEEEGQDGVHANETVGWIAIQGGGDGSAGTANTFDNLDNTTDTFGLGATFTDAVVLGETQTINGGDPGTVVIDGQSNSDVDLFFEEEASNDAELNHVDETVGIVAFETGLILCFGHGTLIETPHGPVPVETLQVGDMVLTLDNGPQPLRWTCADDTSAAEMRHHPELRPVLLRKDAIAPGYPHRDTYVSPQHRVLMGGWKAQTFFGEDEVLVPAQALLNDTTVHRDPRGADIRYVHLLFDTHQIIFANGAPMESFHPGHMTKSALTAQKREELFQICPNLRTEDQNYGQAARPVLTSRQGRLLQA